MYETDDLLAHVLYARDRNVWPIFNVLISQEGVMNPSAIAQLADVAAGLASSRHGITVPALPSVAQLPSSLARTGPVLEGPIFWRQNTHLVGWEHANAFAAWLLDVHECERGLRVTFSSPCHAASLRDLSVSLHPQDHCQISFFDDDTSGFCGENQSGDLEERRWGGWVCSTTEIAVQLRDDNSECNISGFKHAYATLGIPWNETLSVYRDEQVTNKTHEARLVWLLVTRNGTSDINLDIALAVGEVVCV
jgi:hypothetical protein